MSNEEQNCFSECHRDYAMTFCNCSPTFLFIDSDSKYPSCDVDGLLCLMNNNRIFNSLAPQQDQEVFFENLKSAMKCDCPAECTSQNYMYDTSISLIPEQSQVQFDVHYRGQHYNIVYMSHVSYNAMNFLVALGGIVGLFLGGSFISGVELLYFFTFRFFYHWKKSKRVKSHPQPTIKFVQPCN